MRRIKWKTQDTELQVQCNGLPFLRIFQGEQYKAHPVSAETISRKTLKKMPNKRGTVVMPFKTNQGQG